MAIRNPDVIRAQEDFFSPNLLSIDLASDSTPPVSCNISPKIAPIPTTTAIYPRIPAIPSWMLVNTSSKCIPVASPTIMLIRIKEIKACILNRRTKRSNKPTDNKVMAKSSKVVIVMD
jgi:hypothetical protein